MDEDNGKKYLSREHFLRWPYALKRAARNVAYHLSRKRKQVSGSKYAKDLIEKAKKQKEDLKKQNVT